jgi:hypothetical protein
MRAFALGINAPQATRALSLTHHPLVPQVPVRQRLEQQFNEQ